MNKSDVLDMVNTLREEAFDSTVAEHFLLKDVSRLAGWTAIIQGENLGEIEKLGCSDLVNPR